MSPDDRGEYEWLEAQVDDIRMVNCFYNKKDFARRKCVDHDTWDSPDPESELDYDGTQCITQSTSILQDISSVSTITIITKHKQILTGAGPMKANGADSTAGLISNSVKCSDRTATKHFTCVLFMVS